MVDVKNVLNTRCQIISFVTSILNLYYFVSGDGTQAISLSEKNEYMTDPENQNYYTENVLPKIKDRLIAANLFFQILKLVVFFLYYWKPVFVRCHFPLHMVHAIILCASPTSGFQVFALHNLVFCLGITAVSSTNFKSDVIVFSIYSIILHFLVIPQVYNLDLTNGLVKSLWIFFFSMAMLILFHVCF